VQWASWAAPFPATVKQINGNWDARTLHQNYRAYRHMVLDCPPSLDSHASYASLACLRCGADTGAALADRPLGQPALPQEIEEARKVNANLKAYLVLNQLEPKSAISSAMHEALADFGMPVLNAGTASACGLPWRCPGRRVGLSNGQPRRIGRRRNRSHH
jgi:chromosome partitioning protein